MKRFTMLFAVLGVLAAWSIFEILPVPKSSAAAKYDNAPIPVYDATGAMLEAINVESADVQIVPVYDATGAMLEAINPDKQVTTYPVYDATGAMLAAINPDKKVITVPAYDATGAMLDAILP